MLVVKERPTTVLSSLRGKRSTLLFLRPSCQDENRMSARLNGFLVPSPKNGCPTLSRKLAFVSSASRKGGFDNLLRSALAFGGEFLAALSCFAAQAILLVRSRVECQYHFRHPCPNPKAPPFRGRTRASVAIFYALPVRPRNRLRCFLGKMTVKLLTEARPVCPHDAPAP